MDKPFSVRGLEVACLRETGVRKKNGVEISLWGIWGYQFATRIQTSSFLDGTKSSPPLQGFEVVG
jgi:hypothetical protein